MADEIEFATEKTQVDVDARIAAVRAAAENIDPGKPGECRSCETQSPRLVRGLCVECRERIEARNRLKFRS